MNQQPKCSLWILTSLYRQQHHIFRRRFQFLTFICTLKVLSAYSFLVLPVTDGILSSILILISSGETSSVLASMINLNPFCKTQLDSYLSPSC